MGSLIICAREQKQFYVLTMVFANPVTNYLLPESSMFIRARILFLNIVHWIPLIPTHHFNFLIFY